MMLYLVCFYLLAVNAIQGCTRKAYITANVSKLHTCDTKEHIPGETYIEMTNFLHAYVINKKNIHPRGQCRNECDSFTNTKTYKCFRNRWCQQQPPCPKIRKCQYMYGAMEVCLSDMATTNRRYEFIKPRHGNTLGPHSQCKPKNLVYLESQVRGLFDVCHYCFCVCDEGGTPVSDVFVSLRTAVANVRKNRVVTGLRFVKHNRIVHFQIREGELISGGKIKKGTTRWVPVPGYRVTDPDVVDGIDYHKLTWEHRSIHLDEVLVDPGFTVTGVGFRRYGGNLRLHLEILMTPFDVKSGKLKNPGSRSMYKTNPDIMFMNKFASELKLNEPDVPTRLSKFPHFEQTSNKYVKFTQTSYLKDAAQSTVPFFDAQPLMAEAPLEGVGIFHKGHGGSGGFIAPSLFVYHKKEDKYF